MRLDLRKPCPQVSLEQVARAIALQRQHCTHQLELSGALCAGKLCVLQQRSSAHKTVFALNESALHGSVGPKQQAYAAAPPHLARQSCPHTGHQVVLVVQQLRRGAFVQQSL